MIFDSLKLNLPGNLQDQYLQYQIYQSKLEEDFIEEMIPILAIAPIYAVTKRIKGLLEIIERDLK